MQKKVFIIAEAGVNHNGNINTAIQLIDVAAASGADAVKFQSFVTEKLVTFDAKQADYQISNLGKSEGQYTMLKKLELSADSHKVLIEHCAKKNVRFMSTAFDDDSIDLLKNIGCTIWKIPSGEITNLPYLRRIGSFGQDVVLSTGMANLGEVEAAIDILTKAGTKRDSITLLHCTSEYPASICDVNLNAMVTLRDAFKMSVGYSDHTIGNVVSLAAVALGAQIIEKHFTLDRNMIGPDHKASMEPNDLIELVSSIRLIEQALGNGLKTPSKLELQNASIARKSIYAKVEIKKDEVIKPEFLMCMRPVKGVSPMEWDRLVNKKAIRNYKPGEPITD